MEDLNLGKVMNKIDKCIVHIGAEKTGTTTIQHYLYSNREKLLRLRVGLSSCIEKPNNRALVALCMSDDKYDDFFLKNGLNTKELRNRFLNETKFNFIEELTLHCKNKDIDTFIITSEHFHSRIDNVDEVNNLKTILSPFFKEIEIVLYLREQTKCALSLFSTVVKTGALSPVKKNYKQPFEYMNLLDNRFTKFCPFSISPNDVYFDYLSLCNRYVEIFGKESVSINIFHTKLLKGNDIVTDFFYKISLDVCSKFKRTSNKNGSLGWVGLRLQYFVNAFFPRAIAQSELGRFIFLKSRYFTRFVKVFDFFGKAKFNSIVEEDFKSQFKISNKNLNEKYFKGKEKFE